jgi:Na+/alanine symporter
VGVTNLQGYLGVRKYTFGIAENESLVGIVKQTLFNLKCNHNDGIITHIQAFATVISGTVGLGTISGVAIAITIGGPNHYTQLKHQQEY